MSGDKLYGMLDPDQRKAVELRKNGAVSAGAGSGKTTVLAARYLDLVLRENADVRSILVLTFTRKAAAQMYGRIHRALLDSGESRALEQVDRFSEAQISTLDSFCSLVLRPEAQEYGYPPDFRVDDEECARISEARALSFLLERREDPALREIFARLGFETAWKGLFADAAARLWTPSEAPDIPAMLRLQADAAARTIREQAAIILDAARAACDEGAGLRNPSAKAAAVLDAFATLPANLAGLKSDMIVAALDLIVLFNLKGFGRSDSETLIKEAAGRARDAARLLAKAAEMESLAPLAGPALGLLAELGEQVRKAKRLARVMGFRDVASAAVDLLSRRPEIRAGWKDRFRHIMIDEFQDDDELQKDLLYLLAERRDRMDPGVPKRGDLEPDKLFFVGDEKQSIYRFRGADVAVFRGLAEDLGADGPALRTNYRSEPELVSFFNQVFERVFAGAEEPWEARFSPILSRAAAPGGSPSIRYLIKPRRPPRDREGFRSDDEALAHAVASFVRDSVESGKLRVPDPKAPGAWRPAGYDDFAVLLRSTGKQYLLEKHFRLLAVPYAAGDVCGLFTESPANDVYQALRLAVHLEDGPAYAAFLRSPFVRVSDDAFVRILALGLVPFDPAAGPAAELSEDDAARFDRGRGILERLQSAADRRPVSALVRSLWYGEGLRLGLLPKPDTHPFLEHFDYLFRLAADADARGLALASFVSELEPRAGTPERLPDLDAPREAGSGLRILTVHKAKGLEFPVVILPFLDGRGKSGGDGKAWYLSREHGITLNLRPWDEPGAKTVNLFFDLAREEEARQEAAERKRLFYVACTRASAHLVFAAAEPGTTDERGASFHTLLAGGDGRRDEKTGAFAALPGCVREIPVPDLDEEEYRKLFAGDRSVSVEDLEPRYRSARIVERAWDRPEVSATAVKEAWQELRATRGAGTEQSGEELPDLEIDRLIQEIPETAFGELCHAAVQALLDPSAEGAEAFEDALSALPEDRRDSLAGDARRLARGFLDSELGRAAAAARAAGELRMEAPFLFAPAETPGAEPGPGVPKIPVISGRMDLCFRAGDRLEVVDFKSDRRRREGEYDGQLAAYRAACRELHPGMEVRTWLFWLRAARAEERPSVEGEEVFLAEAARRAAVTSEGRPGP